MGKCNKTNHFEFELKEQLSDVHNITIIGVNTVTNKSIQHMKAEVKRKPGSYFVYSLQVTHMTLHSDAMTTLRKLFFYDFEKI